jgi:MFS family permease
MGSCHLRRGRGRLSFCWSAACPPRLASFLPPAPGVRRCAGGAGRDGHPSRTFGEGPERNRALGVFGATSGIAAIVGPVCGGLLVQGPGWQWVFFINVLLGTLLAGFVLARLAVDATHRKSPRTDIGGAATLTSGLIAATFGVHESIGSGWLRPAEPSSQGRRLQWPTRQGRRRSEVSPSERRDRHCTRHRVASTVLSNIAVCP